MKGHIITSFNGRKVYVWMGTAGRRGGWQPVLASSYIAAGTVYGTEQAAQAAKTRMAQSRSTNWDAAQVLNLADVYLPDGSVNWDLLKGQPEIA